MRADDGDEADDDVDRGGFVSFWRRKDRVDVSGGGRPTNLGRSNQDFDNPDFVVNDDNDDVRQALAAVMTVHALSSN